MKKLRFSNITISGGICTGKSTLVPILGKKIGWRVYSSGNLFREYAKKNHLSIEKAEEQNENISKKIDYSVKKMLKCKKNIVVDAWMGGIMAQNIPHVLKVLLICNDDIRYSRFSEREKISIAKARERIKFRERNLLSKLYTIYKIDDIFNPNKYNIVINTSDITAYEAAHIVMCILRSI